MKSPRLAFDGVLDYVRNHGTKPRYRGNRLLFLAPDHGALARLRDCIRVALAWNSIVEDVAAMRLVLDNLQTQQAKKELLRAEDVLPRVARECYKWLLCPAQDNPTAAKADGGGVPSQYRRRGAGARDRARVHRQRAGDYHLVADSSAR